MAWNDYISLGGIDAPNLKGRTFTINTKDSCAVLYSDTIFTTSWTTEGGRPSAGGVDSYTTANTNHVIPFIVTFRDDGNYNSVLNLTSVSATIVSHPAGASGGGSVTFTSTPQPPDTRYGYYQDWAYGGTTKVYTTNLPIIAMSTTTYSSIENYISNHKSAWLNGTEDFWAYFNDLVRNDNAIWVNVDFGTPTEPEGTEYTIYNTGQRGTWTTGDIVSDVSTPFYRWARVKLATTDNVDGRLAFYKGGLEDGVLKLIPVSVASVVACEYSTDGGANWQESDTFPFAYIYDERTDELGTFIYATRNGLGGQTGVPIFEDETTATKWVNHDATVDITDASNYESIANRYPQTNKTGTAESSTDMGTANNFRSHFTQKYILDRADVTIIANALFDTTTNIFEDIKKGLEMFGEKIIDSICGLAYYPIDLTTVFSNYTTQNHIFFGGYQFQPSGSFNVNRLNSYNGYLDLGTFDIEPSYPNIEDVRNYSPYCNCYIFLPYAGLFQLNYSKYVGKTVSVRYYIDLTNGSCLICLFCNGLLYDYFNGNMATQIPVTITDYSGFANAELRNLSNLAGVGVNVATLGASGIASAVAGAGQIGGVALGSAGAGANFAKSMYDLSTTNINQFNTTKGNSGAVGNQYLPQYIYLIFEYIDTEETGNLIQLEGKPSNKSGSINSFSGYLEVDSVNLVCSGATEKEKQKIINMLHSGIII